MTARAARRARTDPARYVWGHLSAEQQQAALAMLRQAEQLRRQTRIRRLRILLLSLLLVMLLVALTLLILNKLGVFLP
ncbi:MAG TPA: hypothetical protein VGN32_04855 [Ktedonobacterales bacterium]|nr:hypothetical protein [Ktedonobacterales bacterium]